MNATKPQGIDQDEVEAAIVEELVRSGMPGRPNGLAHVIADRILALVRPVEGKHPEVIVLCGSTRFYDAFQRANFEQTMAGRIVLSVGFYAGSPDQMVQEHGEGVGITPEQKLALDELHKRKIDLADRVLVLNVGGYIGDSTRSEIRYALAHGKPVDWLEPTLAARLEAAE